MLLALWSPKGGSGTSVVAAAVATLLARRCPTLLVDLAGDQPSILGLPPGAGPEPSWVRPFPTLAAWLAAGPAAPSEALEDLAEPVNDGLALLRLGGPPGAAPAESGAALAAALAAGPTVVGDAGRADHPAQRAFVEVADTSVVVIRGCYLALRRAIADDLVGRAAGVVVVSEPGRSLGAADVGAVLGCPVLATIRLDPAVARAVDAGLLVHRPLGSLCHPVRSVVDALCGYAGGWAA